VTIAIIGSGALADRLAAALADAHQIIRIASTDGASAEDRLSALAGAAPAQAAIGAAESDEQNLIAAALAKRLGVARTGAVVLSPALAAREELTTALGIDRILNPEFETAAAIVSILEGPAIAAIQSLGRGRIRVWEAAIPQRWPSAGSTLRALALPAGSRIALIRRAERALAPTADGAIQAGDRVLIAANHAVADAAAERLGVPARDAARVTVAGPPARAERLARLLTEAGVAAESAGPGAGAAAAASALVLIDGQPPAGVRSIVVSDDAAPSAGVVTPGAALARAAIDLLPRAPVERVGTIVPGELDVYRAEADEGGDWLGRPLRDLPARPGGRGWIILAIQAGRNVHLPHPSDAISPREVLIIAGPPGAEPVLERGLRAG
jgi:trk system potassium uptake protein TrkA